MTTSYEKPEVTDYGSLVELTAILGNQVNSDVPKGLPNSAFS